MDAVYTDYRLLKKTALQSDLNEFRDSVCRRPVGKLLHKTALLYQSYSSDSLCGGMEEQAC